MKRDDLPIRVALCGRHLDDLRGVLSGLPFEEVTEEPGLVISYGGDGSLLGAEREFPGVPKLPVRDGRTSRKCTQHSERQLLEAFLDGDLSERKLSKLEARADSGDTLYGLNDVLVNKSNIASGVRYRLWLDDDLYADHQIVGDGIVVSTPFGSTGYYRSITHSLFRIGIGIAFNNSTEPLDHLVVPGDTSIRVEIIRGPAVLLADNSPARIELRKGDSATINRAKHSAVIFGLEAFRCRSCFELRHRERPEGPGRPFVP